MALSTPTALAALTSTDNDAVITTGTINPSDNALLIVNVGQLSATNPTVDSISTTLSNVGTWTIVQDAIQWQPSPVRWIRHAIAYAKVTGDPGSGTITATFSAATRGKIMRVEEVTGHDTTTPVAQSSTNTGTSTSLTVTLSGTPDAASMVYASIGDAQLSGITAGTGFTEVGETGLDAAQDSMIQTQYDYQSADTTADWTTLSGVGNAGVAIEINEAGGEPPPVVVTTTPLKMLMGMGV